MKFSNQHECTFKFGALKSVGVKHKSRQCRKAFPRKNLRELSVTTEDEIIKLHAVTGKGKVLLVVISLVIVNFVL